MQIILRGIISHSALYITLSSLHTGYRKTAEVDSNNLTRSGYITPAVDFKNLQEVLIITSTKADLTGGEKK